MVGGTQIDGDETGYLYAVFRIIVAIILRQYVSAYIKLPKCTRQIEGQRLIGADAGSRLLVSLTSGLSMDMLSLAFQPCHWVPISASKPSI